MRYAFKSSCQWQSKQQQPLRFIQPRAKKKPKKKRKTKEGGSLFQIGGAEAVTAKIDRMDDRMFRSETA